MKALNVGFLAAFLAINIFAQDDPSSRVARLNYISGTVSMQPAGMDEWAPAELNRPFTTGDTIYADAESRAEFHLDTAVIRAGDYTSFGFLLLYDQSVQLRVAEGDVYINLRDLAPNQTFEVDSPNAAVSLLRAGVYRFRVASNGGLTFVVVRDGQAEVTGSGQAFNLTPGNSASLSGSTQLSYEVAVAPPPDDFDLWSQDRDAREAQSQSAQYLPPSVVGYEDMDQYGQWQTVDTYGPVWYPSQVDVTWAPYRYGHWAWIEPWGWTWVDDAPWGFAPFHYGRWVYLSGRWAWCPGPIVIVGRRPPVLRPIYAPALVAWFGGDRFGVAVHAGAPSLGWVPLGYGEVYTPSYNCSARYFNNVNVSNTTIVRTVNITNVYNTVYVNKTIYSQRLVNAQAPNAVTAMSQTAFASGRPVMQSGGSVAPRIAQDLQPESSVIASPGVSPAHAAYLANNRSAATVARPPAAISQRAVVARATPAVTPVNVYPGERVGPSAPVSTSSSQASARSQTAPSAHPANPKPAQSEHAEKASAKDQHKEKN